MLAVDALPWWYWAIFGGMLGGVFSSFGAVLAYRYPRKESLRGRSRCGCGEPVRARDNVPVIGWLRLRGRAACCGEAIPVAHPLGEALGGLLCATLGALLGAVGVAAGIVLVLGAYVTKAALRRSERTRTHDNTDS